MSASRRALSWVLIFLPLFATPSLAERVAIYNPPDRYLGCGYRETVGGEWAFSTEIPERECNDNLNWKRAAYFKAGSFGGYGKLGEETLNLASLPYGNAGNRRTRAETAFQAGGGALFRLSDSFVVDVGLFASKGEVTREVRFPGSVASETADLDVLGGHLAGRFYPWGIEGRRFRPWLSAAVEGMVLRPQSGVLRNERGTTRLDGSDLQTASTTGFASALGFDIPLSRRLDLTVSGEYGFEGGWRAAAAIVVPLSRPKKSPRSEPFENPYERAGELHNRILDQVLADIRRAHEADPRAHRREELFALVEESLKHHLERADVGPVDPKILTETRGRAERGEPLTIAPVLASLSPDQRGYAAQAFGLLDQASEAGDQRAPFRRIADRAFKALGPSEGREILAHLSVAGHSAAYWVEKRFEWSETVRRYLGTPPPDPPEGAGLRWFKWGQVAAWDLVGGFFGGSTSAGNPGAVVIGAAVSSAFNAVEQLVNHWLFSRLAPLGCIPRGGRFCDQPGYGCLVMFPDTHWPEFRRVYPEAVELNGEAQIRLGERPSLEYEFLSAPPEDFRGLPLDSNVALDRSAAAALGFKFVTLLKGPHELDRSLGRFGGVVFDVAVDDPSIPTSNCQPVEP